METPDRLPPQDLEAEIAVLGSVLLDNSVLPAVRALLKVGDFYSPDHQAIFACMLGMAGQGEPVGRPPRERGHRRGRRHGAPLLVAED